MSKRKLLLADDSITIQKVVNLTFADEGIEVISVGDGDSAMRKFDEFIPDLVMADVNMPGLNGYEVCRIIKRTEETRNIPVILLVGSFEPFDEAEAKEAGADDFLTKPFQSIRQLVNKVTDLLSKREHVVSESPGETQEAPPKVDSFADTLEIEERQAASAGFEERPSSQSEFGDAGMDDEMIETSPANEYVSDWQTSSEGETPSDFGKTQPLNAEDLKGFDIIGSENAGRETRETSAIQEEPVAETSEPPSFDEEARKLSDRTYEEPEAAAEDEEPPVVSETEPQIDYYLPEQPEFKEEISDAETLEPEVSYSPEEPRTADFSQAETVSEFENAPVFEESGEMREVEATPEAATGFIDEEAQRSETFNETEAVREIERDLKERSQAEEAPPDEAEETPEVETETETPVHAPEPLPPLNFDDGDLLELPPLVEETGIRPQPKPEPVKPEPETVEAETPAEPEPETTDPETTLETGAAQSFPPELIEAIAQKVAEKISAKTMNDVLPQITELVMKKMAEGKSEDKK